LIKAFDHCSEHFNRAPKCLERSSGARRLSEGDALNRIPQLSRCSLIGGADSCVKVFNPTNDKGRGSPRAQGGRGVIELEQLYPERRSPLAIASDRMPI
jgi:hypothetical protein